MICHSSGDVAKSQEASSRSGVGWGWGSAELAENCSASSFVSVSNRIKTT
jgi:hypothetical protein